MIERSQLYSGRYWFVIVTRALIVMLSVATRSEAAVRRRHGTALVLGTRYELSVSLSDLALRAGGGESCTLSNLGISRGRSSGHIALPEMVSQQSNRS